MHTKSAMVRLISGVLSFYDNNIKYYIFISVIWPVVLAVAAAMPTKIFSVGRANACENTQIRRTFGTRAISTFPKSRSRLGTDERCAVANRQKPNFYKGWVVYLCVDCFDVSITVQKCKTDYLY